MVIAIYVDWMVWWIQCCRPFLGPLIAFVPSIPQKRIKVLSRPFDASNLITTFKSVAFLDAVSQTIPRKHSLGVWVCASNYFIFLWQFFFFKTSCFFYWFNMFATFFRKKKQISVLIMVLWEGFSLLVSCIRVLLTGFTKPAYFLWAI